MVSTRPTELPTTVVTTAGAVRGTVLGTGVHAFLGVPYAEPPVGARRFAPPRRAPRRDGVRPATSHGPASLQGGSSPGRALADLSSPAQAEDCLTVAVWTPSPDPAARLPVLVWIHGGAFVTGSASVPAYDGGALAARGVVVVGVTYRLGLLGWLRCPALGASGNQGLADQLAALDWVQENIGAFGGDPANVTAFGESAGAASIVAHIARGGALPFQRGVVQSGSYNLIGTTEWADATASRVLDHMGGDATTLAHLDAAEVMAVQEAATPRSAGVLYGPVADGGLVPEQPASVLASGRSTVAVLAGTNRDEMGFFWGRDERLDTVAPEALDAMVARWHPRPAELIDVYRRSRAERGEPVDERSLALAIGTDATFRAGVLALADWQPQAHVYRFDHVSPLYGGLVGASHVLEVPFVFGTHAHPSVRAFTGADVDPAGTDALADDVAGAWVRFATDGDPGWPAYVAPRRATRLFGGSAGGTVVDDPAGTELARWDPYALP